MKRPQEIAEDEHAMAGIVQLTSVFESIASMKIARIRNQVLQSQQFFSELWHIYEQIRVGQQFSFGRGANQKVNDKELFIIITAEGGFSGDIDQKLIQMMRGQYQSDKNDIVVIGHHGAIQLAQAGISYVKYYKLPSKDQDINTDPLLKDVQAYRTTSIYYQTYVSLTVQDVRRLSLGTAIEERSRTTTEKNEEISEATYIFEPSTFDVVDHLERSMVQITLSQLILESKLAQYASRFQAMTAAHTKADENLQDIHVLYNRTKRAIKDERLKEIMNGLRLHRAGA